MNRKRIALAHAVRKRATTLFFLSCLAFLAGSFLAAIVWFIAWFFIMWAFDDGLRYDEHTLPGSITFCAILIAGYVLWKVLDNFDKPLARRLDELDFHSLVTHFGEQDETVPNLNHSRPGVRGPSSCILFPLFCPHLLYCSTLLSFRALLLLGTSRHTIALLLRVLARSGPLNEKELAEMSGIGKFRLTQLLLGLDAVRASGTRVAITSDWKKLLKQK